MNLKEFVLTLSIIRIMTSMERLLGILRTVRITPLMIKDFIYVKLVKILS